MVKTAIVEIVRGLRNINYNFYMFNKNLKDSKVFIINNAKNLIIRACSLRIVHLFYVFWPFC